MCEVEKREGGYQQDAADSEAFRLFEMMIYNNIPPSGTATAARVPEIATL